jgi:hypothetical protein
MSGHNWILPAHPVRCVFADTYYRTGQVIFQNLTGALTPDRVAAVRESLEQLRADQARKMAGMHFGVLVGRHRCLADVHQEALALLRCLATAVQPAPEPPPAPPAPPPKPRSLRDVVNDFAGMTDEDKPDGE